MSNLVEMLSEHGIYPKSYQPGISQDMRCPKCGGGAKRSQSFSLTIDTDGLGAVWQCFRQECLTKGNARAAREAYRAPPKPSYQKPPPVSNSDTSAPDWLYDFFAQRKIGSRTVSHFGIYATQRRFAEPVGPSKAIVFPYLHGGQVVNRKYRPHPAKNPQLQEKDALPTLFNADAITGDEMVVVEGEPDVLAMFECGVPNAVTLKDGAGGQGERRFEGLSTHADMLGGLKRIVLAGDNDVPGIQLRDELARRLGRHRCWIVSWPVGCKDACDTLIHHGLDAVVGALASAERYPIKGLQRVRRGTLRALRDTPPPGLLTTGTRSSDHVLSLPAEGRVIIVTGYPSHGKTSWMRFMMLHTCRQHERRWAVFTPEHQPWEYFAAQCCEVMVDKPFYRVPGKNDAAAVEAMSNDEIDEWEPWLGEHLTVLACDAEDETPTLDWILTKATESVMIDGTTDLEIDPWNEIDHQFGDLKETDYIGKALQRCRAFAMRYGCNVWIVAHPAKPMPGKNGEAVPIPGPYSISGSQHWANKADLGLTLFIPEEKGVELHIWKSRFRRWGSRGAIAKMHFDELTGRYREHIG